MTKIRVTYKTFLMSEEWHGRAIGLLVGMLMMVIYLWMLAGFVNLLVMLFHSWRTGWSHGAELMVKDVVVILAALELIRVLQSYLSIGRVRLTFILDVALVVLIGELISLWYQHYTATQVILSIFVIAVLAVLRIVTTKYSPD